MSTWIALFRGINVGGHRKLPMKELVAELEVLGHSAVSTYIQSGNAVFRSGEKKASVLSDRISEAIESSHGFKPHVLVVSLKELRAAIKGSPFPKGEPAAKTVHLFFLSEPPRKPDLVSMDAVKAKREKYVLAKRVLYLHTPDGFGKSKLAGKVERSLGVPTTARNWRSATKILEIAEQTHREETSGSAFSAG